GRGPDHRRQEGAQDPQRRGDQHRDEQDPQRDARKIAANIAHPDALRPLAVRQPTRARPRGLAHRERAERIRMGDFRSDLARLTLGVLFIAALIGASLWILRPFLPAVIWAATLVIATWPLMRRVQDALWGSRALAVTVMTLALLLVFVVPFWLAIGTIARNAGQILAWAEALAAADLPPPPDWLGDLPLIGPGAVRFWQEVADTGVHELLQQARPYAGTLTQW